MVLYSNVKWSDAIGGDFWILRGYSSRAVLLKDSCTHKSAAVQTTLVLTGVQSMAWTLLFPGGQGCWALTHTLSSEGAAELPLSPLPPAICYTEAGPGLFCLSFPRGTKSLSVLLP